MILIKETVRFFQSKRGRRRTALSAAFIAALALTVFPATAFAAENIAEESTETADGDGVIHNEEIYDIFSGESAADEDETEAESDSSISEISSDSYYDSDTSLFVYNYGDSALTGLSSNVADGMYVNSPVSLTVESGITGTLYRDGVEDSGQDLSYIDGSGYYVYLMKFADTQDTASFSFRIIDTYTNVGSYTLPEGFELVSATVDGEDAETQGQYISMTKEGQYDIIYTCTATKAQYVLTCTVDHTAPTLRLAALNEKGIAHSAVDISDLEYGAVIYAELNGSTYDVSSRSRLTEPGSYTLTVQDAAGNNTVYSFMIRLYFTMSSIVFFSLIAASVLALIVYVVISRKRMKIR